MCDIKSCTCCPRQCKIDRTSGKVGFCKSTDKIKIAKYMLHFFEEPCISGKNGSGAVFFSNCTLNCKFCQNHEISQEGKGYEVTIEKLSDIFLELQNMGANNINLVTPTAYVLEIIESLKIAKKNGLNIPIIYNTSGYESVEILKKLENLVDVYLPDMKYASDTLAMKYSKANNYTKSVKEALLEMKRQVKNPVLDENGIIKRGLIVRHLILPNNVLNTKAVLKWISNNLGKDTWISIMAQYFPTYKALEDNTINRKITSEELDYVYDYIEELGMENGYIQSLEENETRYVPKF